MSPLALTTERVYAALKRVVLSNRYRPGCVLPLRALARECGTSVSPVRDAMARLCGERILEPHPGGGFQCPTLHEKALRDLYGWHAHLLRLVLRERRAGWVMPDLAARFEMLDPADSHAIADATSALFCQIAEGSANREHGHAVQAANDRLHATRIAERALPNRVAELKLVAAVTASGSQSAARAAIWSYHRRRLRRLRAIVIAAGGLVEGDTSA